MFTTRFILSTLAAASLAATTACAFDDDLAPEVGEVDEELIGATPAPSTAFDAIGTIAMDRSPEPNTYCTGTLVAPKLVLTSEMCVELITADKTFFIVGKNSNEAPRRAFKVTRIAIERSTTGGVFNRGMDIAVLHLEKPVDGVTPLPLADLKPSHVGRRFRAFGFGFDEQNRIAVRRSGETTLLGIRGKVWELTFGSVEEFLDRGARQLFPTLDPDDAEDRVELTKRYERHKLIDGAEAWFSGRSGDAQLCHGDQGGPMTTTINGKLTVLGVGSWMFQCKFGSAYTAVTPALRSFVDREARR